MGSAEVAGAPPRLTTGWSQVGVLSLTEVTSWGILYYAFPVFLQPMQRSLGWSVPALTGAYSLALLCSALAAIPVGRWLDRQRNPRLLMTLGSLLGTVGVLLWASVTQLAIFYVLWIGLGVAMAAVLYEPAFASVAAWFPQRRERALTVLTSVGGLASVIYLPLAAILVQHVGWRLALLLLAGMLALGTAVPQALGLRPYPALPSPTTTNHPVATLHLWRSATFWWMTLGFVGSTLTTAAVMVHLIPYLETQHMTPTAAATAAGLVGTMSLAGRLICTWLSTTRTRALMTAAIFGLQALGVVVLLVTHNLVGFIVLFGAGFGVISPARAGLVADYFGTAQYGRINGQLAFWVTLARAAAPTGASLLLIAFQHYATVFGVLSACSVLAAGALLGADLAHRRNGDDHARD